MTLIWFTLGFVAVSLAALGQPVGLGAAVLGLAGVAAGLLLTGLGKLPKLRRMLAGGGMALVWLTGYGLLVGAPAKDLEGRTVWLEGVVTQWAQESDYGVRVVLEAGEAGGKAVPVLFYGDESLAGLAPGDHLRSVAYCTPADRFWGEESLYYSAQGIRLLAKGYGQAEITRGVRAAPTDRLARLAQGIREEVSALYPPDQAGFLHALLTGRRAGLDPADQNLLARAGLGHVVVISGLHVSFLMGLLTLVLDPKKPGHLAAILLALVGFCLMTGSAPGTVRAVVLCALALLAPLLGRDYHALTGLCAALLLLLFGNPYAVANAGLQFSFLSTLGILLFGRPWAKAWTEKVPKAWRKWARPGLGVLAVSLGAMLFTVPLSAWYFREFSLAAPLTNLCATWAVSLVFAGGGLSVLAGWLVFPLGQGLAWLVGLLLRYFFWVARKASAFWLAAVTLDQGYLILWTALVYAVLLVCWKVPGRVRPAVPVGACLAALALSVGLTVGQARRTELALTVLDVGQGQSVAVTSAGARALIDCGGTWVPGDRAATYLQSLGWGQVDLLLLTHFHQDHAGGVLELMDRVKVARLALPDIDRDSPLRRAIEEKAAGQGVPISYITQTTTLPLGRAQLTLYPPPDQGEEENEACLAVLCAKGDWSALLTGDMPAQAEQALAARAGLEDVEVLVAGHHGSKYSTGQALLQAIRPETVVLSVGKDNPYGHPAPETLARLEAAGAAVYRTDQMGSITIQSQE